MRTEAANSPSVPSRAGSTATSAATASTSPGSVIFDVDGTLVDTVDLHAACWVEALKHHGIDVPFEDMRLQIGKGGDQILHGLLPPDTIAERGEAIQAFRSGLFERDYMRKARAFPGVRPLFERIRAAGQRVVLASSGTAGEVEGSVRARARCLFGRPRRRW